MTKEEVMNSIALKKRFCKDNDLPIAIFDNPYFYERLQTIDPLFNCIESFNKFCTGLQSFINEEEYFKYYNEIEKSVINFIKKNNEYNRFISNIYSVEPVTISRNLYIEENDNRAFISINMKKANFSAMKHYSPKIFDGADTWEEFLSKFTNNKHIIDSEHIRQVILEHCNPNKQITYEYFLMNFLCEHIIEKLPGTTIFSLCQDEILINIPHEYGKGCGFSMSELRKVINDCPNKIGEFTEIRTFELQKIEGTDGYAKIYNDDSNDIEFKCLNAEIFHQIVKHYYGKNITKNDLVFYHNGKLARFLEKVNNPWN